MMVILEFLGVLILVAIADIFWTKYIMSVNDGNALFAGFWSSAIMAAIMAASVISVSAYVGDNRMKLAAILGAFIGAFVAVRFKRKNV